jgi:hypothetical protein
MRDPDFCQKPENVDLCENVYEGMEMDFGELINSALSDEGWRFLCSRD